MNRRPMNASKEYAHSEGKPSRLLVALAATWMILSLAIGGALTADARAQAAPSVSTGTTAQP